MRLDDVPAQTFFRTLTHDDRDSFYCIARRDAAGTWRESFATANQLVEYSLFDNDADWYVSRNGFTKPSRAGESVRQINAFMFDIDCHQDNARYAVSAGIAAFKSAVAEGKLPEPTLLVDTGRGLHLYYVLERSVPYHLSKGVQNTKGISFFRGVETLLLNALRNVLGTVRDLEIDTAVFDFSRVGRIPGTYNCSAHRFAELVHSSDCFYTLSRLKAFFDNSSAHVGICAVQKYNFESRNNITKHSKYSYSHDFSAYFFSSRLRKIEELQKLRGFDCKGSRELMCFCFYNTAVQALSERSAAFSALSEFNARFIEPLSKNVLAQISRSVDKVGFYKMSAATIARKLLLTPEESGVLAFAQSRREMQRAYTKNQTAEKRNARNRKIVELYQQPGATLASVAQAVGVSRRTVAYVLKHARSRSNADFTAVSQNPINVSSETVFAPKKTFWSLLSAARQALENKERHEKGTPTRTNVINQNSSSAKVNRGECNFLSAVFKGGSPLLPAQALLIFSSSLPLTAFPP